MISIKNVVLSPHIVPVGETVDIYVMVTDVAWQTIADELRTWQDVADLTDWNAVKNYMGPTWTLDTWEDIAEQFDSWQDLAYTLASWAVVLNYTIKG
ncbi:MAG TPA: hypothetical protein VN441_16645 [Syntrophomonas sp.]|nr:hypothetical protein [Syntrophomonas sp.]